MITNTRPGPVGSTRTTSSGMTCTVVSRTEWERPAPPAPNGSTRGGTDYGVTVIERKVWPQDGSIYAGRSYDTCWTYLGPDASYRDHVVIGHSDYPTPA